MLLIPSASYRAPDFMAAAAKLGIDVVVASDQANPLEGMQPERNLSLNFSEPEAGTAEVERYADRYPLDLILAVDDGGTRLAAHASRRLELPHNPVSAVEATTNKLLLRQRLAKAEVDAPKFATISVDADPAEFAASIEFPVVLKPLSLSASRGVIRADDAEAFVAVFDRVRAILREPKNAAECAGTGDRILVEGYIPGIEVSLEGLLTDGKLRVLALFDKPDPLEGPFFEETIYVTPSRLPEDEQEEIAAVTQRATAGLGLRDGPVHAELRINEDGIFPIDIAARSIGGLCARTLQFGTGMSLEEILLRHAVGEEIESFDLSRPASGVMMIPIPRAGTLAAVTGIEAAEAVTGIESVTISMPIGSEIRPLPEGDEYLGFIFAVGDTPADAEAALREAHARLEFEIR